MCIYHTWFRSVSTGLAWEVSWPSIAVSRLRHGQVAPNRCLLDEASKKQLKWWLKLTGLTEFFPGSVKTCSILSISCSISTFSIWPVVRAANREMSMLSFGKLSPFQRFVTGCQTADNKSLRFNFFKSHSRLETNVGLSNKVNTPARCRRPMMAAWKFIEANKRSSALTVSCSSVVSLHDV